MHFFKRCGLYYALLLGTSISCRTPATADANVKDAGSSSARVGKALSLNDVSMLFALGNGDLWNELINTASEGAKGRLLPTDVLGDLAKADVESSKSLKLDKMKVTAMRVDPCAPQISSDASKCLRQVRLVWQDPTNEQDGAKPTLDVSLLQRSDNAVHALYQLDHIEFTEFVHGIAALKAASGMHDDDQPLNIQPVMKAQGLTGAYYRGVKALILKYCGVRNLTSLAFLVETANVLEWKLSSVLYQNGQSVPQPIVGSDKLTDKIIHHSEFVNGDEVRVSGNAPDTAVLSGQFIFTEKAPFEKRIEGYRHLVRLVNPQLNSVATTNCASCHVNNTLLQAENRDQMFDTAKTAGNDLYTNANWNLSAVTKTPKGAAQFHNFSYHGGPSISQRTINESAAVADYINAKFFSAAE